MLIIYSHLVPVMSGNAGGVHVRVGFGLTGPAFFTAFAPASVVPGVRVVVPLYKSENE
jgi:hypothetical protein